MNDFLVVIHAQLHSKSQSQYVIITAVVWQFEMIFLLKISARSHEITDTFFFVVADL